MQAVQNCSAYSFTGRKNQDIIFALAFYDKPRFTRDIDIIILPEETERIKKVLNTLGYFETSEPWTFKNANISLHRFMKRDEEEVDILKEF